MKKKTIVIKLKLKFEQEEAPINEQLKEQGFRYTKDIGALNLCLDAVDSLRWNGFLPPSEVNKIDNRIFKHIMNNIEKLEG